MKKIIIIFTLILLSCESEAKVYVAEPYLIDQSAYSGAEFYVYRPYNMPSGWFVTFDGYAVAKTKDGVWVYGNIQGGHPVMTNYIVGTVNPGLAGIIPFYTSSELTAMAGVGKKFDIATQPIGAAPNQTARQAYMPDWAVNPKFMAIRNWRGSIDRIGVLQPLGLPIAWKGEHPRAVFAWTGEKWFQIDVGESEQLTHALKRNLYVMTRARKQSRFEWFREDIALLTEKTVSLGYYWMGEITVK